MKLCIITCRDESRIIAISLPERFIKAVPNNNQVHMDSNEEKMNEENVTTNNLRKNKHCIFS